MTREEIATGFGMPVLIDQVAVLMRAGQSAEAAIRAIAAACELRSEPVEMLRTYFGVQL